MNNLELKQKIFDKLKSVDDVDLLWKIMNLLQPLTPNEILHLNENEVEMAKESEEIDIKSENIFSQEQLEEDESEWITEL